MISTWLDQHLQEWVRPKLGVIPKINPTAWFIQQWTQRDVLALQAVWQEGKKLAKGRNILLAGRDVWLLEVLARIEGFPTIFRPDISSSTCNHVTEDYTRCYLLDTGFSGTVPKAMGIENFGLIKYNPPSYCGWASCREHQVFPRAKRQETLYGPWPDFRPKTNSRGLRLYPPAPPIYVGRNGIVVEVASKMERSPKYWTQAFWNTDGVYNKLVGGGKIDQRVESEGVFRDAACLTLHITKLLKPSLLTSYRS